jgi:alpha-galactosidase
VAGGGKPKHLTPNEQYTHVSMWCLLSAPLLLGCDLDHLDNFTLGLMTNDEVIDVDQDELGKQALNVSKNGDLEVYAKPMVDGSKAVGLFNLGPAEAAVTVKWSDLGVSGKQTVRDLWRQQDVGAFDDSYTAQVASHGVVLVRVIPATP